MLASELLGSDEPNLLSEALHRASLPPNQRGRSTSFCRYQTGRENQNRFGSRLVSVVAIIGARVVPATGISIASLLFEIDLRQDGAGNRRIASVQFIHGF